MSESEKLAWADKVLKDPSDFTPEEVEEATKLSATVYSAWDTTIDEWDEIADIEDDEEREKALAEWWAKNPST